MRVSELFEAENKSVPHGKVVDVIYGLALKYFKAPAVIKQDAARLIKQTDEFWTSAMDDVTEELQGLFDDVYAGEESDMQDFFQKVDDAVEDCLQSMQAFYKNEMNHAPGYKAPTIIDSEPIEVPGNVIEKAFAVVPGFTEMVKANSAIIKAKDAKLKKERLASVTPAVLQQIAELVDRDWDKSFGQSIRAKIAKNPKWYDFKDGFAPKSEEELVKELIATKMKGTSDLATIVDWVVSSTDEEVPKGFWDAIRNVKTMKQIVSMSKNLKKYM